MLSSNENFLDLKNYERHDTISVTKDWEYSTMIDIRSGKEYMANFSQHEISKYDKKMALNLSREVNTLMKFNHPSILKMIGYNPYNYIQNEPKPVIMTETTTSDLFRLYLSLGYEDEDPIPNFSKTNILIIIYGIAAGMQYLHSHDIIHCNLFPEIILLNEQYYPKISDFSYSKNLNGKKTIIDGQFKGNPYYLAPEIYLHEEYSKSSDVYSFALIVYQLVTKEQPFMIRSADKIKKKVAEEGFRPEMDETIPLCYRKLINKCWSNEPKERPSFDEIVYELRNNKEYLYDGIDSTKYEEFIKYIDNSPISFDPTNHYHQLDDLIKSSSNKFHKSDIDLKLRGQSDSTTTYLDLKKYELEDLIERKDLYFIYKVVEKQTNITYLSYNYLLEITNFLRDDIINFCQEINIISQLDHPAILKCVGCSNINYDDQPKPVIISEFGSNLIEHHKKLNDTQKLIIIYGIAAGMSFLHSHDIIHRDLKYSNIYLDNLYLPKIFGFTISQKIDESSIKVNDKQLKGSPAYLAPEVYLKGEYGKSSDVYSFAFIVYQLLTDSRPFNNYSDPQEIEQEVAIKGNRPTFDKLIPSFYRKLIERCWSQEQKDRPTFDEIVHELKTNREFITEDIDEQDFREYIEFVDNFQSSFNPLKRIPQFDYIIESRLQSFTDIGFNTCFPDIYETRTNSFKLNYKFLDLGDYMQSEDIATGKFYNVLMLIKHENDVVYAGKNPIRSINNLFRNEIINYTRELNIILQLDHPAIIKCLGYCSSDNEGNNAFIVNEYASKGTLEKICEVERSKNDADKIILNDTQKLIVIYGIATGMSYLHSHNVIHCDLKPENIYLDDSYYPKISGFSISKELDRNQVINDQHIKGTAAFLPPEVYLKKEYSKQNDVYSFALIVYELVTLKRPYENMKSPQEIKKKVAEEGFRPEMDETIPLCYRKLINKCWSNEPNERPSFDDIVYELRNNKEYLYEGIDSTKYEEFIKYIDNSPISFDPSKQIPQLNEYFRLNLWRFRENDLYPDFKSIYETEKNDIRFDCEPLNLTKYQTDEFIGNFKTLDLLKISDEETNIPYFAFKYNIEKKYISDIEDLYYPILRKIKLISELNHPSFLNFIGYSPTDFKGKLHPIILTEFPSNCSLDRVILLDSTGTPIDGWNDTKKLICIYGIASFMSYLHLHDILHRDLKASNIYLDEYLFPKITGFEKMKRILNNALFDESEKNCFVSDDEIDSYTAPEIIKYQDYKKSGDVFSFGIILYRMITKEDLFYGKSEYEIKNLITQGVRPVIKDSIPSHYRKLIEKCWSQDQRERPTFDQIVYELKTNPEFINSDNINKEEYQKYIEFIEEVQSSKNKNFDEFKSNTFNKVIIDFNLLKKKQKLNLIVNIGSVDIDTFEKIKRLGEGTFGVVYKVIDTIKSLECAAKVSKYKMDQCSDDIILNLSREVDILSRLNHPSILQFAGFSPCNFKHSKKPVIITEFAQNDCLDEVIEKEKQGLGLHDWDDTKKLINIYGIAAGMKYLHSLNIIHRDLKPANILLDEFLYPKIADFGLSKNIYDESESTLNTLTSGLKGTYLYCAPEIIENQSYSKAGDVYAFGMIVYKILTNELPIKSLNKFQIMIELIKGVHIEFNVPVSFCFRNLILECLNKNTSNRPTFEQIVNRLENDREFITANVDKDEFINYVSLVNESIKAKDSKENSITKSAKEMKESNHPQTEKLDEKDENFLDLSSFERKEILNKDEFSKLYKIQDMQNGHVYAGQISTIVNRNITEDEKMTLKEQLKIISKMSHPSLLKFYGYSQFDFKQQRKPVIVTEIASNQSLKDILEIERMNRFISGWNESKKLITIYGIASGMSYLHSHGIIHRLLKPSSIYLDDSLFPKIGDFGLSTQFLSDDKISNQTISGFVGTPTYSSPEVLQYNNYSKSSDVYAFAIIVYEIITKEIPFNEIDSSSKIFKEVVMNQGRPKINHSIPICYKKLIEKCWSQNPEERPTFSEIVYELKNNTDFLSNGIKKDDYLRYIQFIENGQQNEQQEQQKDENIPPTQNQNVPLIEENSPQLIIENKQENSKIDESTENSELKDENAPFVENLTNKSRSNDMQLYDENANLLSIPLQEEKEEVILNLEDFYDEQKQVNMNLINNCISLNKAKELISFLNDNCDHDTTSSVFNHCFSKSSEFYLSLCKEGILIHNAVAHHKYALHLIFIDKNFEEAQNHLKQSINLGFNLSYFSLARLYFEAFKDHDLAYKIALEGSNCNEKYSKCLLGYFYSHGIGTRKDLIKGASIILDSQADDIIENFSTEIALHYIELIKKNKSIQIEEEEKYKHEAFIWFEKAFNKKKTMPSINNYASCFMKGIGVEKNVEKANEILRLIADKV